MLKVTYKSPPSRDKVLTFPDGLEEIRFGRTEGTDVPFPETMSVVGHDHFAIRREAGVYKFVINPHHRVFVYGKDAYDGQELTQATEVRLGRMDGPRLWLEPSREAAANYVATEPQGRAEVLPDKIRSNARWAHILGAVVGIGLLIGIFAYSNLSEEVSRPIFSNAGAGADFSGIIAKAQKSVFLVDLVDSAGNSKSGATAWVVALPGGRKGFATNAHVAAMLADAAKDHLRLVVRSPEAGHREYEIVDAMVHPAYSAFNQAINDATHKASNGLLREVDLSPAYDVALLIPATQDGLPDPLPLARSNRLATLHAGEAIAFVGYPAENLVNFDVSAPAPTSQVGIITSVRNFFLTADGGPQQLIEHSLPSAGGASGSPIFDSHGLVIAVLSGGNNISSKEAGRIPNAALVNFAQRVDLLEDLIEGKADDALPEYKAQWAEALARWSRPPEALAGVYAKSFEDTEGKLASFTRDGKTGAPDPAFDQHSAATFDVSLNANTRYLVTAYTGTQKPLRIVVTDAANPSAIIDTTVHVADGPLAVVEVPAGGAGKARVAVVSEATDGEPVPFKLQVFWPVGPPPKNNGQENDGQRQGGGTSGTHPPASPPTTAPPAGTAPPASGESGGDEGQTR
ncbi:MAG: trypsin-like peptidase domain-containing protein [Alphaproteobacteria bacterium]|nr:trypsin-like peptidase domain-containing protein [Alphaproteobacteria bacterium]